MFIDTSGFLCLFDRRDSRHRTAIDYYEAANLRITHNLVLTEFVILSQSRGLSKHAAIEFVRSTLNDGEILIIWVEEQLTRKGLDLLSDRLDKGYSLCDAVSFVLMRRFGLAESLSTDRHFEQEGFVRLLPSNP